MTSSPIWTRPSAQPLESEAIAGCRSGVVSEPFGPCANRRLADARAGRGVETHPGRACRADARCAGFPRRTGALRLQHAAAARTGTALDDRAHGTWHCSNVESAIFWFVQSRREF